MKVKLDYVNQNKLIILAFIVSTCLIVLSAFFAVNKIKNELEKSYKTISYINFKNVDGKILYSTNNNEDKKTNTNITSPIFDKNGKITGSFEVGMDNDLTKNITKTTKKSILLVFSVMWLVFTFALIVSALLAKRDLAILHHGVRAIEKGRFGTILNYNQGSNEIKELFDAFNKMSVKLHSYEEKNIDELTLERNKLEAILMNIANGVVVCDNFDNVVLINYEGQKILNNSNEEILNTQIQNYCDSKGNFCFKDKIAIFKDTPLEVLDKKPLEFNVDIDTTVVKSVISPMYSKTKEYLGYIIVLIDITKQAEVDRLKSAFISNVSHELRTPVTILSSYADTLYNYGDELKDEEKKEFIQTINEEVVRLNNMVNDILDFSRIQKDIVLEKEKGNIAETISKICKSHQVLAKEKNIELIFNCAQNLPLISYNAQSIERVISNLITNAIKYSYDNSKIIISAQKENDYLKVSVKDNGMGIEEKYLDKIFERFYRIENQVHTIKGTGLGLHLVKVAIEKHHQGKVFVSSKLNEGSTFSFLLPVDKA